jgi:hypothetical protein
MPRNGRYSKRCEFWIGRFSSVLDLDGGQTGVINQILPVLFYNCDGTSCLGMEPSWNVLVAESAIQCLRGRFAGKPPSSSRNCPSLGLPAANPTFGQ